MGCVERSCARAQALTEIAPFSSIAKIWCADMSKRQKTPWRLPGCITN
jgi:hypothetical protein